MVTKIDAGVTAPKGFKAGGHTAGFKPSGLPDLAIVLAEDNKAVTAAALFTKNLLRAAPVDISEQNLKQSDGMVAAVVLNSGQANAGTGTDGFADGIKTTELAAEAIGCQPSDVFICSTGVIGKRFDINLMREALPKVVSQASSTVESGTAAATAIMTTDLKLKQIAFQDEVAGSTVTAGGMCKGSGMIHPDMATMLGVVTCDADVEKGLLHKMLKRAVDRSFNAITVDGDTSTNDVVCAMCSGASKVVVQVENSPEAKAVESLLTATCIHLAKSIARDGEGATVLVEVQVSGANTEADARAIAKSIASSSLVKAAIFGRDPNWGRIAAAAGMAGAKFDINDLEIRLGDYLLMSKGNPVPFDAKDASLYMKGKSEAAPEDYLTEHDTVAITVKVGNGEGSGVAWGCDLSYKYVEINAEYTT
ncbi:glutamate N-acetyltransferase / amino-acid N-acetyltransferase [Chondrus crispus]|uniref:Arginine biosynthesis bifunctional protein ArgJ, mitochondrial n=1 Tax=Chondrus crispus TaxID=2769 RepID=R7Q423_CHOCR|nr:glutamate N-acetyltransferase / amino-acid N-acetyltransferase [Chondrus crispus]CDF32086.1 glutamate N-acetyltransferase / amino-acid N-acetyltransferase [Chondrus crispus]|eukprot:XP_005711751.1 glutamate N-acetyltransferase / amino-acid N-acetyltransferase [Chondrus crispus]